jgi:hypothetical protein
MGIGEDVTNTIGEIGDFIQEHPIGVAVGTAGAVAGGVVLASALTGKSKKVKRRKSRNSRKRNHRVKHRRHQKLHQHYGLKEVPIRKKHKKVKHSKHHYRKGKVYYARKTGQPYIILSSGKAKFIKGKRKRG